MKKKSVRLSVPPTETSKVPRPFLQPLTDKFIWAIRCDKIDWDHVYYGFGVHYIHNFVRHIKPKLDKYSTMKWSEIIKRKSCHPMDVYRLNKEFIERIKTLFGEDAPETLYQIPLKGTHRIWGYRDGNIFYLMFNDPGHQGYLVRKKHT